MKVRGLTVLRQHFAAPRDHIRTDVAANEPRADEARFEEDAASPAERIQHKTALRDSREVDEDPC